VRLFERIDAGGRFGPDPLAFLLGSYAVRGTDILFASDEPPDSIFDWYRNTLDPARWVWQFDAPQARTATFERYGPGMPDIEMVVRHVWSGALRERRFEADQSAFVASGRRNAYAIELFNRGWFRGEETSAGSTDSW